MFSRVFPFCFRVFFRDPRGTGTRAAKLVSSPRDIFGHSLTERRFKKAFPARSKLEKKPRFCCTRIQVFAVALRHELRAYGSERVRSKIINSVSDGRGYEYHDGRSSLFCIHKKKNKSIQGVHIFYSEFQIDFKVIRVFIKKILVDRCARYAFLYSSVNVSQRSLTKYRFRIIGFVLLIFMYNR